MENTRVIGALGSLIIAAEIEALDKNVLVAGKTLGARNISLKQ
jgi:hypothetical protein